MAIKVRYNGLEIDGNLLPLFSGAFHYWRSAREDWPHIFDQIKGLGFAVVESYVPWSVHELAPGDFDFGRTDPRKDLDAWLSLAHQKGFKVLLRPGPCINSELPDFGYPERLLHDPELAALGPEGNPVLASFQTTTFQVPSYADERIFEAFDGFLSALAPLLQKHLHPHGAVVALQVDNELGYFFNTDPYSSDYAPASLALWAHFLDLKYRQLNALNRAWNGSFKSFEEAPAPRCAPGPGATRESLRAALDWVEYKEYQILWALGRLSELYRGRGLGAVPFFHNFFSPWTTPFNIPEIEGDAGIDFCGLDSYPHAEGALHSVDQARYLSSSSRLAYFPEFGAGTWPLGIRARDLHDQACTMLAPLMGGARGLNFYMLVERDRWLGSPLDVRGTRREDMAGLYERFNAFLRESEWTKASPLNQGLLLHSREAQQHEAAFLRPSSYAERGSLPAELLRAEEPAGLLGEGQPLALEGRAFYEAARAFCAGRHFSFSLADNAVAPERLARHAFVLAAMPAFVDENLARRLRHYAEEGGLLVLGPAKSSLNSRFEPLQAFADLALEPGKPLAVGDGKILWLKAFDSEAVAAFLRKGKIFAETELSDPSLELAAHKSGGRLLLFVRNPHAEERTAKVQREGKFVLKPLWASGKFLGAVEERDVVLAPHEIKVWEVIAVS
jgi:beta-galactosidase